ncbi:MAG: hypothetical protein HOJ88_01760 [Proteobacteria bacterium]|jgi:thiamine pyrophosphate-dependent acetolactate synthase large subunit-like protein|nr:hypothetical protein [Pseudomonadota bacterium]
MFEPARQFLDNKIDRRTFITRLTKTGVSLTGAAAIANALVSPTHAADGERVKPEASRILKGMTGGDLMCEFMTDWGVPYLFGLAGSEETGFLDALVDRTHIGYATCLHESAAMAIADGYSRATGETSIVQLHSIAGLAYALGKLVGTYRDRIPVVVTAGRQATDYRGQDGFLEAANQHTIPQDYSQWVWDVMSASTIPEVMRRAFLYAEAPPGGPSFVSFSKDLWEEKVAEAEIIPRSRSSNDVDVSPPDGHV